MSHNKTPNRPVLGCIADDVTGATDLAINLVNGGFRVVQVLGVPDQSVIENLPACDAIVVALKTRSIPKFDAINQSLQTLAKLQAHGIERFYFKYCSTFDSTPDGNIGPVSSALMTAIGVQQTIYCPAFPRAGRTVYQGHLFVNGSLLNESGMENHPLNPMTDSNLVRFLSQQVDGKVGLLSHETIMAGIAAIEDQIEALKADDVGHVVTDCLDNSDLQSLASLAVSMPLVTGGSGLARYLPDALRTVGAVDDSSSDPALPSAVSRALIIAGSCSRATNAQVAFMQDRCPTWRVNVTNLLEDADEELAKLIAWAHETQSSNTHLIASTSTPDVVADLQEKHGAQQVASAVEDFLGRVAQSFTSEFDAKRLILAGGETSGAIVQRLGIQALRIGPEICAGVPWTESIGEGPAYALALKSGNFGDQDFFQAALEMLP